MKNLSAREIPKTSVSAVFPRGVKGNLMDKQRKGHKSFNNANDVKVINVEEITPGGAAKRMGSCEEKKIASDHFLDIKHDMKKGKSKKIKSNRGSKERFEEKLDNELLGGIDFLHTHRDDAMSTKNPKR